MKKLAIITSHPIQYNAPLFQLLTERGNLDVKIFYTWGKKSIEEKYDPGFGKTIKWDIPLLDGYNYEFLENVSKKPGSSHFSGIINPEIVSKIKEYNPSAILVYGWSFKSHLKVLKYFHNKLPILFRGDSTLLNDKPNFKQKLRQVFLTWVYSKVDYALYVGKNNKDYYKKFRLKEEQLFFAPHCVDAKRFNNEDTVHQAKAQNILADLNITANQFVFLYAGKLEPIKNVSLLLKAFETASFNNDVKLIIVGNGPLEKELKEQYQNNKNIHFLPFQNQQAMPAIYRLANYYVLPSKSETWGLAVNESMACGRPAIASSKVGCAVDLIENGETGFVFESENEESLKQALLLAFESKRNYQTLSNNAVNKIATYSLENVAIAIEKTISNL